MPPAKRAAALIDEMGVGPAQVYVAILAHGIWLADGMEMTMITALTASIAKDLNLSRVEMASLTSIVFVGIMVGVAISGYVGDKFGRRPSIVWCYASVTIMGVASAFASSFAVFSIIRLFLGIAMGVGMPTSTCMVSEMSPVPWRMPLQGMRGLLFSLGNVFAAIVLVVSDPTLQHLHWRVALLVAAVPAASLGLLAFIFLPESPTLLAANGRLEEAEKALECIGRWNGVSNVADASRYKLDSRLPQSVPSISSETPEGMSWCTQIRAVGSRHLAYSTCVLAMSLVCIQFVEYGSIYAEPRILLRTHSGILPGWQLISKYSVNALVRLLVILPAAMLSRRFALVLALCCCVVGLVLFAQTGVIHSRSTLEAALYHGGFHLPLIGLSLGNLVVQQLSVEIYPTWAAATGAAFVIGIARVGPIMAPFVFEFLPGPWQTFYYLMASVCVIMVVFVIGLNNLEELTLAANEDAMDRTSSKSKDSYKPGIALATSIARS